MRIGHTVPVQYGIRAYSTVSLSRIGRSPIAAERSEPVPVLLKYKCDKVWYGENNVWNGVNTETPKNIFFQPFYPKTYIIWVQPKTVRSVWYSTHAGVWNTPFGPALDKLTKSTLSTIFTNCIHDIFGLSSILILVDKLTRKSGSGALGIKSEKTYLFSLEFPTVSVLRITLSTCPPYYYYWLLHHIICLLFGKWGGQVIIFNLLWSCCIRMHYSIQMYTVREKILLM